MSASSISQSEQLIAKLTEWLGTLSQQPDKVETPLVRQLRDDLTPLVDAVAADDGSLTARRLMHEAFKGIDSRGLYKTEELSDLLLDIRLALA